LPTILDWLLLAIVVVGLGVRAAFGMRTLRRSTAPERERIRRWLWARAIVSQWVLVAALVALWLWRGRPFSALGLEVPAPWGFGGVMLGVALMAVMLGAQRRQLASTPALAARVRARLEPVEALMPHTEREWAGFVPLAITAGVCEELLFRGFVTWLLASVLPAFWMAALAQAVLFGLAHGYQGGRGVWTTGAVGVFLAGIVWVTGSLWAAMLVHALMDLHTGDMARRLYASERDLEGAFTASAGPDDAGRAP
jgi:membrane protease YdiL (CAAX protease family)